jgi:hypothetical protein
VRQRCQLGALGREADRIQHAVGQDVMRFGVHAQRTNSTHTTDHRASVACGVGDAADHTVWPAWFALLSLENRNRWKS